MWLKMRNFSAATKAFYPFLLLTTKPKQPRTATWRVRLPSISLTPLIGAEYKIIAKKGEGTFSEVVKGQNLEDGSFVAIKRMKGKFQRHVIFRQSMLFLLLISQEQVDNLREVQALRRLNPHPNIIRLHEVIL
jgi:serine/threonine protein kinase